MVGVGGKDSSERRALAAGRIRLSEAAFQAVIGNTVKKGDVVGIAQLAGIMGAKKTSDLIPLCHPLPLTGVSLDWTVDDAAHELEVRAEVTCSGKTGVEMEALTAVSVALLTVYDMCKAIDKHMVIGPICLLEKDGGKSGAYRRSDTAAT